MIENTAHLDVFPVLADLPIFMKIFRNGATTKKALPTPGYKTVTDDEYEQLKKLKEEMD